MHEFAAQLADATRGEAVPAGHVEGAFAQHGALAPPAVAVGEGVGPDLLESALLAVRAAEVAEEDGADAKPFLI